MGIVTGPAGFRRGLVAVGPSRSVRGAALRWLLVLGLALVSTAPLFGQPAGPGASGTEAAAEGELNLVGAQEVLAARCSRIHENPLNLLFLLPGGLLVGFAAAVRRRKGLLVLLVAGALGATFLGADGDAGSPAGALLEEAERRFAAGSFEDALALYREAGSHLPCNPALEHNLGICYAENGQTGYAVVHLRRSLQARPADPGVRRALAFVEERAGLEGQLPMPVPVNPDLLYVLTLVLANLSLAAAGYALRRKGVRALIVLILLTISAGISLGFFLGILRSGSRPVGVIVARDAGLLKIPEERARASFVLPPGTSLRIRGKAGDYYLVETASRFRGWVRDDAIVLD